jgi:hypothetical protein
MRMTTQADTKNRDARALVTIQTRTPPTVLRDGLQTGTKRTLTVDVVGLEAELRARVRGEVRFSGGDRGMYASDASNYRMVPLGVILPRDAEDVIESVAACRRHGAPIFARGGGTGIPGQTVNEGVLFDFSKYMNRLVELDPRDKRARRAGDCSGRAAQGRKQVRPHFRPRPRDAQPMHARRYDRQQLLRHALRHGGRDGRQHRRA